MEMQSADPVRALVAILIKNVVKKASDVCHAVPEVARERLRLALMHVDALPVASVAGQVLSLVAPCGAAAAAVVTPHRQQGHHTASSGTAPPAAAPHRKQRHRTASSGTAPQAAAPHRKQRHRTASSGTAPQAATPYSLALPTVATHHKRLAGTALPAAVHRHPQEAAISRRLPSAAGCRQQRGTVSSGTAGKPATRRRGRQWPPTAALHGTTQGAPPAAAKHRLQRRCGTARQQRHTAKQQRCQRTATTTTGTPAARQHRTACRGTAPPAEAPHHGATTCRGTAPPVVTTQAAA